MPQSKLRFARFIRVSTDRQKKRGESLRIQQEESECDIPALGGNIVATYGGSEHATAGWEKQEFDRMLADAARSKFDAIWVLYPNRWSRDNVKHFQGLEVLQKHRIRFFVGRAEYDLLNPTTVFQLNAEVNIGDYVAKLARQSSQNTRKLRACDGRNVAGKRPFGRIFDKESGKWSIDEAKKAKIVDIARRYLRGEHIPDLAVEHGLTPQRVYRALKQAGPVWVQRLRDPKTGTDIEFPTVVGELLPDKVIKAVRQKKEDNRTCKPGAYKNKYLLSGRVICGHCGERLSGNKDQVGKLYYAHQRGNKFRRSAASRQSNCLRFWVPAEAIEDAVISRMFEDFGNPRKCDQIAERAMPNQDEMRENEERLARLTGELEKVKRDRNKVIDLYADQDDYTKEEASDKLDKLRERENRLREQIEQLESARSHSPNHEEVKRFSHAFSHAFGKRYKKRKHSQKHRTWANYRLIAEKDHANSVLSEMTEDGKVELMAWDDRLELVEMVLSGKLPDGKRMGVYITCPEDQRRLQHNKSFRFEIKGRFCDLVPGGKMVDWLPYTSPYQDGEFPGSGVLQRKLREHVVDSRKPAPA
jgi:DNA invertase Pin-like site-specific DNA recombinase